MGSADQANITVAELNRTMRVSIKCLSAVMTWVPSIRNGLTSTLRLCIAGRPQVLF